MFNDIVLCRSKQIFQLTEDIVNLVSGLNVLLSVEEELRPEQEPAQTLLLQTEELTVWEKALKQKIVT